MSRGVNKVILVGDVADKKPLRQTSSGSVILDICIATKAQWHDSRTNEDHESIEWHDVCVFGKSAEIINKSLNIGSRVFVEGSVRYVKHKKDNGRNSKASEIHAYEVEILSNPDFTDRKSDNLRSALSEETFNQAIDDGELPF